MESPTQFQLLKQEVIHAYEKYPFYREKMDGAGINPYDMEDISDFERIPFTTKYELSNTTNSEELFDTLRKDLFLMGSTSGSTGAPMPVYWTHHDVDVTEQLLADYLGGLFHISAHDVVQITVGRCGIFCQVLVSAMRKLGAACMPVDPDIGTLEDHLCNMNKYKVTVLIAYPTIVKRYCEIIEANRELKPNYLRTVFLAGETWPDSLRTRIREITDAEVYDWYGTTETGFNMYGCPDHKGIHTHPRCYVEIIERNTGRKAEPGEYGEVVLTPLWKKGIPFIRYRTGDIAAFLSPSCTCTGNPIVFSRIQGRWDDVIIIAGVKINPLIIEDIIIHESQATPNFQIVLQRQGALEKLKVVIETSPEKEQENDILRKKLVERISQFDADMISLVAAHIIALPEIEFVPMDSISRTGGKIRKVVDLR